jgi:hypothetical protein
MPRLCECGNRKGRSNTEDFPDSKPVAGVGLERLPLPGMEKRPGDVAEGPRLSTPADAVE